MARVILLKTFLCAIDSWPVDFILDFFTIIFTSKKIYGTSNQASLNGGKARNVEAPVYTQAFDAGNKEADLYLTSNPYGFDLFNSHLASSSVPAPLPTPSQATNQPVNQNDNPDLKQIHAISQPAPLSQSGFSSCSPAPHTQNITAQILQEIVVLNLRGLIWDQITDQLQFTQAIIMQ
ncbi:hypothetical protein DSO57_1001349 [Entomophthora muscae]|uniref:Uncharacterized protein n=1 Tax=Entomophthora muscae TaxID=34485 RepID=A0ACC2SYH3_9FUNG|nr:hypothetical protein DSO57_1001349 [Entomophthora muscae]